MIINNSRKPKNKAEGEFWDFAIANGWGITKRGWADFFCWKDGKIMLVEVKSKRGRKLKKHQHFIMEELSKFGVNCYRWDSQDKNFQRIDKTNLPI